LLAVDALVNNNNLAVLALGIAAGGLEEDSVVVVVNAIHEAFLGRRRTDFLPLAAGGELSKVALRELPRAAFSRFDRRVGALVDDNLLAVVASGPAAGRLVVLLAVLAVNAIHQAFTDFLPLAACGVAGNIFVREHEVAAYLRLLLGVAALVDFFNLAVVAFGLAAGRLEEDSVVLVVLATHLAAFVARPRRGRRVARRGRRVGPRRDRGDQPEDQAAATKTSKGVSFLTTAAPFF